jgi:hypothetical protein
MWRWDRRWRINVYDALPLAMNGAARDPSAFAGLAVGVSNYSTQAAGPSTGSFNGGQTYQNEVYIEGLPLTSAGTESDTRNLAFGVSVEAVDQFQVETAGAKAMYEGQGVSNYVFKSGTNQFHGGVFEYFRNTDFDARGFFAPPRRSSTRTNSAPVSAAPSRRTRCFSSATTMATALIRRRPRISEHSDHRRANRRFQRLPAADLRSHQRHRNRRADAVPEQHDPGESHLADFAVLPVLSPAPTNGNHQQLSGDIAGTW